ncbi:MAG: phosphopantothenoylcysteine decarboxylase [Pirellulales bacterium]|nr:phosphopantothenoylcysteine decarboxylase [Pirellulales bacterium]
MAHILITAGPTRAYIDDVRFLTNASSGRMAAALASAAIAKGHNVTIVTGPVSVRYPTKARVNSVITTGDMLKKSLALLPRVDGVIATAAPCDFEPKQRQKGKLPRQRGLALELKPTRDIIATLARQAKPTQWMVAFALEPDGDPAKALKKITAKKCDLIVLNDLTALDTTTTAVTVYDHSHKLVGQQAGTKASVARWLLKLIDSYSGKGELIS